jgi:oligopeptide/dipeptide ABC transporter ATP-binding protein
MALIDISNLSVEYTTQDNVIEAVNDVSFTVDENEQFGLVGESGSGKSTVAKSILRILPDNGAVTDGSIEFEPTGLDLATASGQPLRDTRWAHISMIAQSAMNGLDPVYTLSEQIVEAIELHRDVSRAEAEERVEELLEIVGLDVRRRDAYPHQLSGGMRQRAMIAMALALEPELVIADEPTTALDVITQDHILKGIAELTERLDNSLIVITHDMSVIAETCDRVGVMYGGELVEVGPVEEVFTDPEHPYTLGLVNAFPTIEGDDRELITMPGEPPDLSAPPTGCNFADRCPYSRPECSEQDPSLTRRGEDWTAACWVSEDVDINAEYDTVVEESEKWQTL